MRPLSIVILVALAVTAVADDARALDDALTLLASEPAAGEGYAARSAAWETLEKQFTEFGPVPRVPDPATGARILAAIPAIAAHRAGEVEAIGRLLRWTASAPEPRPGVARDARAAALGSGIEHLRDGSEAYAAARVQHITDALVSIIGSRPVGVDDAIRSEVVDELWPRWTAALATVVGDDAEGSTLAMAISVAASDAARRGLDVAVVERALIASTALHPDSVQLRGDLRDLLLATRRPNPAADAFIVADWDAHPDERADLLALADPFAEDEAIGGRMLRRLVEEPSDADGVASAILMRALPPADLRARIVDELIAAMPHLHDEPAPPGLAWMASLVAHRAAYAGLLDEDGRRARLRELAADADVAIAANAVVVLAWLAADGRVEAELSATADLLPRLVEAVAGREELDSVAPLRALDLFLLCPRLELPVAARVAIERRVGPDGEDPALMASVRALLRRSGGLLPAPAPGRPPPQPREPAAASEPSADELRIAAAEPRYAAALVATYPRWGDAVAAAVIAFASDEGAAAMATAIDSLPGDITRFADAMRPWLEPLAAQDVPSGERRPVDSLLLARLVGRVLRDRPRALALLDEAMHARAVGRAAAPPPGPLWDERIEALLAFAPDHPDLAAFRAALAAPAPRANAFALWLLDLRAGVRSPLPVESYRAVMAEGRIDLVEALERAADLAREYSDELRDPLALSNLDDEECVRLTVAVETVAGVLPAR